MGLVYKSWISVGTGGELIEGKRLWRPSNSSTITTTGSLSIEEEHLPLDREETSRAEEKTQARSPPVPVPTHGGRQSTVEFR